MTSIFSLFLRRFSSRNLEEILSKMPKDTTEHIQRGQKQRIRIKEKSKFYSPGTVNLQVLGSGARGSSSSIYLFSEQSRYLFNCSEGTQRLAHEHRTKLTRMEHIFLTRKSWSRFGGVPGLCLTLQEIGVPKINLHGPPGIADIFQSTRKFVVLRNMKVETPECQAGGFWEDSVMRVTYVPLKKKKMGSEGSGIPVEDVKIVDETDYFGYESKNGNKESRPETSKSPPEVESEVMAYICKLRERPGTLDFAKCVEKGVKPGPLLGRLKNGFDVQLPDGSTVRADDVRGQSEPGSVFIFIDIPDESYLEALKDSQEFKAHQMTAATEADRAVVVVHFSPEEMMENADYRKWMDQFSPSTQHMFINERNEFTGFFASHRIQRQLNELNEQVFPLLKERHPYLDTVNSTEFTENSENPEKIFEVDAKPDKFHEFPELGIRSAFHVRPNKGFDRNFEPYSNPEKVMEDTLDQPQVKELIANYKIEAKKLIKTRSSEERSQEYPRVITFGTGSCIPNKTRNVSANLVHISHDNCALLDCGEGTLGQLVRFYGRAGTDEVLKNMKMIFVSHLHADHHLGLVNILNRRRKVTDEKVLLLAPLQINAWLAFYNYRIEEIFSTYDLFPCADLLGWNIEDEEREKLYARLNLIKVDTCYAKHCPHAFGISMEMKNPMKSAAHPNDTVKITYSGDTLPCDELVNIGQNSDILIHEATMEDDLANEARIKMHSTVGQAIDIGRRMNAKFTILTHFSQRYAKIPLMEGNVKNVAIGFDNMEVTLNDLPMMHLMYEPLKAMFSDHFELMEQKNLKRKYQQERKIEISMPNGNKHNKVTKFNSSDED